MTDQDFTRSEIQALVNRFKALSASARKGMNENATRQGYILPMFRLLGWNVDNVNEVSPEEKVSRGFVDFSFRIGGIPRFFLETKKASEDLNDPRWVQQAIDYAWTKSVTWALLSDFEGMRVFNAEWKESDPFRAQFLEFNLDTYLTDFDRLWWFSREETLAGRLEREADKVGKRIKRLPVSLNLFDDLKTWRSDLYKSLRGYNPLYSPAQIDEAVLRLLNRLIFIRTAEDRDVEPVRLMPLLRELEDRRQMDKLSSKLVELFRQFDTTYNSELFAPHFSEELYCDRMPLEALIRGLYEKNFVRYNFNALEADVLGTAYEQYLGHVVTEVQSETGLLATASHVDEKRLKRKSQGIYYTPAFVTRYIVRQTVSRWLAEHGYNPSVPPRILDMACGSGSFLIEAFDTLDRFVANMRHQSTPPPPSLRDTSPISGLRNGGGREGVDLHDNLRRLELLQSCIFGVDKDRQAVDVARLNLMLRALHGRQKLPFLSNIREGDSLISGTPEELQAVFGENWQVMKPFDWKEEFPEAMQAGGFDIIIGNPPYFNIETLGKNSPVAEWIQAHFSFVWMDKSDILFYFVARAIQLLKGRMGFIVSRAFLEADKAQNLRQFILDYCAIETVIDFQDFRVFEDANISTAIIILRREPDKRVRENNNIRVAKVHCKEGEGSELIRSMNNQLGQSAEFVSQEFSVFTYPQSRLASPTWAFALAQQDNIFNRIDSTHARLNQMCFVGEGMQTGANDVFEVDESTIRREKLETAYLKKHSANSDARRYLLEHSKTWLIWVEDLEDITDCPKHIRAYLEARIEKLNARAAYQRGNCEWWKFTWPLHKNKYSQPKIITSYRATENRFSLDDKAEFIGLTDTTVIFKNENDPHDLKYYLALLNSRLLNFRFKGIGKMTGSGMYEYFKNSVGRLPIRRIDFDNPVEKSAHDGIVKLVEEMLDLQKQHRQALSALEDARHPLQRRIEALDREIDKRVYALYGLTEEEIKIVEGK